ncbi:hypothetical protein [Hydrogenophaga sp.]|nr:hypothetical protein [Hydrogenophaga sp.]
MVTLFMGVWSCPGLFLKHLPEALEKEEVAEATSTDGAPGAIGVG